MATSRARVAVMAGALGLVAVLGVGWLVSVSTGHHPSQGASTGSQGGSIGSTGAVPSNGDPGPPYVRPTHRLRSIQVNGVRLDGTPNESGCVTIINKTSVVAVFESVTFAAPADAGPDVGVVPATSQCGGEQDPPCVGARVPVGGQCVAGAKLTGNPRPGEYQLETRVRYRFSCTSKADTPCDDPALTDIPMSPDSPVEVSGTSSSSQGTRVPALSITVEGASPAPPWPEVT
jgi:hypothetical protein